MKTVVTYANGSRTIRMSSAAPIKAIRSGREYISVTQDVGPTNGLSYTADNFAHGHTRIWITPDEAVQLAYKLLAEAAKEVA